VSMLEVGLSPTSGSLVQTRTLGTATGDLSGAIVRPNHKPISRPRWNRRFDGPPLWVTESGDTIFVDPAQLTAKLVAPNLFAVVTYPVSISGGTENSKAPLASSK